jgi:4-amino-4-deoxy-L-arabinose transferase-like glycosyltransferase
MKLIHRLEQSKSFWFLFFTSIIFFLLRLPSIVEPYWYGDEGIYEVIGQGLRSGRLLYTQLWDNKPPVLYLIYALFDGNQSSVRLTSLIIGLFTVIAFFYLAKRLLRKKRQR